MSLYLNLNDSSERVWHIELSNKVLDWVEPSKLPSNDKCETIFLRWSKDIAPTTVELETLGKVDVLLPPKLPFGYQMQWHPSWDKLFASLYDPINNDYTYEQLDVIERDALRLEKLGIETFDGVIDYDSHPGYSTWCCEFDDSWGELWQRVKELYELVTPEAKHKANHYYEQIRDKAPSIKVVLQAMLIKAEENEV